MANDFRALVFKVRGVTPVPFILAALYRANFRLGLAAVGFGLAVLGELLRIWAVGHAGGATRTRRVGAPELVQSGPYALVRNPLYLANLAIYTGFAVASGAYFPGLPVAVLVFFSLQYALIVSLEEAALVRLFGDPYRDYCHQVPRWVPRLKALSGGRSPLPLREVLRHERSTLAGHFAVWTLLALRLGAF